MVELVYVEVVVLCIGEMIILVMFFGRLVLGVRVRCGWFVGGCGVGLGFMNWFVVYELECG